MLSSRPTTRWAGHPRRLLSEEATGPYKAIHSSRRRRTKALPGGESKRMAPVTTLSPTPSGRGRNSEASSRRTRQFRGVSQRGCLAGLVLLMKGHGYETGDVSDRGAGRVTGNRSPEDRKAARKYASSLACKSAGAEGVV